MRFSDRNDAGRKLAEALSRYRNEKPIVMALPRGGVPVAAEVARAFHAPLGIVLVRKIGAPSQPELALGAVVDGARPIVVRNPDLIAMTGTTEKEFQAICERELAEIERRRQTFLKGRPPLDPHGKVTIVIDDGVATGATMRVALEAMRKAGAKKLIAAAPVAAADAVGSMRSLADDVVVLADLGGFGAISVFYDDFRQLEDSEVTDILDQFPADKPATHPRPVDAAAVRSLFKDIEDAKIAAILKLKPSMDDLVAASLWEKGGEGSRGMERHALHGKAAAIADIIAPLEVGEEE